MSENTEQAYRDAAVGYWGDDDCFIEPTTAEVEIVEGGAYVTGKLWVPEWVLDRTNEMKAMREVASA